MSLGDAGHAELSAPVGAFPNRCPALDAEQLSNRIVCVRSATSSSGGSPSCAMRRQTSSGADPKSSGYLPAPPRRGRGAPSAGGIAIVAPLDRRHPRSPRPCGRGSHMIARHRSGYPLSIDSSSSKASGSLIVARTQGELDGSLTISHHRVARGVTRSSSTGNERHSRGREGHLQLIGRYQNRRPRTRARAVRQTNPDSRQSRAWHPTRSSCPPSPPRLVAWCRCHFARGGRRAAALGDAAGPALRVPWFVIVFPFRVDSEVLNAFFPLGKVVTFSESRVLPFFTDVPCSVIVLPFGFAVGGLDVWALTDVTVRAMPRVKAAVPAWRCMGSISRVGFRYAMGDVPSGRTPEKTPAHTRC